VSLPHNPDLNNSQRSKSSDVHQELLEEYQDKGQSLNSIAARLGDKTPQEIKAQIKINDLKTNHAANRGDLDGFAVIDQHAKSFVSDPAAMNEGLRVYEQNLVNMMDNLMSGDTGNAAIREEIASVRQELIQSRAQQEFWGDQEKFGTEFISELAKNPDILNHPELGDVVEGYMNYHLELQKTADELLTNGNEGSQAELINVKNEISKNERILLGFASGKINNAEDLESLVTVLEYQHELVTEPRTIQGALDVYQQDLEHVIEHLASTDTDSEAVTDEITQASRQLVQTMEQSSFWSVEQAKGEKLMDILSENAKQFTADPRIKIEFDSKLNLYQSLQAKVDELMNNPDAPGQKANLEAARQELDSTYSDLITLASLGQINISF